MHFFDAQLRSDTRPDDDIRNLAYFGTTHAVITGNPDVIMQTAEELIGYLGALSVTERARLEGMGIRAYTALGILAKQRPRRTHHEFWRELPALLTTDGVVAVGEIGAWRDQAAEWNVFCRQVEIAAELSLPIIVTPPTDLRVNMTFKMMKRLDDLGFPTSRVVFNHAEPRTLEAILVEGYFASLTVGAYHLDVQTTRELVQTHMGFRNQMMLNSGLREGLADILASAKILEALSDLEPQLISALTFDTAFDFFVGPTASKVTSSR